MSTVRVRLSGDVAAIARALRVLHLAAHAEGFEIPKQSGLYRSHRERGYRAYVTLRFPIETGTDQRGAAHHRQAIHRPAAPATAKESQGRKHLP